MQTSGIIETYYPSFTKSEKVAADYILQEGYAKISELTLLEFSNLLNIGEATIVRFCRKMNLKGFQELKFMLAIDSEKEKQEDADKHEFIKNNLIQTIQTTDHMIVQKEVDKAIKLMEQATSVLFYGIATSGITATMGESRLFRFGKATKVITDSHRQSMQAGLSDQSCLIIAISVSGETKDLLDAVLIGKEKGCKIIGITNHVTSTLAKVADCVFLTCGKVNLINSGTCSSMVSQLFVLDILTSGYALHNTDNVMKASENIAKTMIYKTRE